MADGLINNTNVVRPFVISDVPPRSSTSTLLQQSTAPIGVLKNKEIKKQDKELSNNIETVLNKLSGKVSSNEVKAKDSAIVADIEQDIGAILSLTKSEGEAKPSLSSVSDSFSSNGSQIQVDSVELKQGIVDVLSIASDILDSQTGAGVDESFTLSLISDLLAMLESLMGVTEVGQTSTAYTPQERFILLIEYIDLIRDDLIEAGDSRFSDVISLVDQQLEEQRYRDRESMKGFSQLEYLRKKGGG